MRKTTWPNTKGHHILPHAPKYRRTPLSEALHNESPKIPLSGEEHVQMHRDIKEVGPIGSLARYDRRRLAKRRK